MEFPFEEVKLAGEGVMAFGTAILESAGEGYPGEFFVSEIRLDKGPTIRRHHSVNTFHAMLFEHIAAIIEADEDAAKAFGEEEQEAAYEARTYNSLRNRTVAYLDAGRPGQGERV